MARFPALRALFRNLFRAAAGPGEDRRLRHEDIGLSDLRRETLNRLLGGYLIVALLLLIANGAYIATLDVAPAYVAFALVGAVALGAFGRRWGVSAAIVVFITAQIGVIASAIVLIPYGPAAAALVIPILIATALLGNLAGGVTVTAGGGIIFAVAVQSGQLRPVDAAILVFGLGALALGTGAILWRPLSIALDWSWASYHEAQRRSAELRERQVELGRLNASLIAAYEQLKQITAELERARQAAEEARRLKSEFAASVSHELRTPLNLIIGLSELMVIDPRQGSAPRPEIYRADVEAIYRNACHISNLIDDVLDLSQIEAHRMGLLKEWASLHGIVAQAADTVRTLFDNTGLALDLAISPDLPGLFVDPTRIRQILINLLNNAVRFTEEGGVTVSARLEEREIIVEVRDTGTGIRPEDLPGVFQEFWRSGDPLRGRRGTGLGLAISKRFAELHGGNLWVASEPGLGSTFSLAIPLGEKSVVQTAALGAAVWQRLEQQADNQPTILLIAPEPEEARLFQRHLEGYQVVAAPTSQSIIDLLRRHSVRAMIAGSPQKRELGERTLIHLARNDATPQPPIITCQLRTARAAAEEFGVFAYLVKPVSQQQLRRTLRRLGRGLRELILVDDDPEILHLLTRMINLLAPRCRVRTSTDGQQLLRMLAERPAQAVFLDLLMPGLDGYRVLEQIRTRPELASPRVVIITAHGFDEPGILAERLEISRSDGLRGSEILRWIRGGLGPEDSPPPAVSAPTD